MRCHDPKNLREAKELLPEVTASQNHEREYEDTKGGEQSITSALGNLR